MWCSRCGVSGDKVRLIDVVSPEGIVKLCESCADIEGFPVIKRPTTAQLLEAEKPAYYGRHYMRGSNAKETAQRIKDFGKSDKNTSVQLRDLVNENYRKKISEKKGPRTDLVDNFHWVIMRARRLRKITQKDLAREISEAEAAISMAEKGILPEDDYKLVKKLEAYLGINIIKSSARENLAEREGREMPARILKIDPESMKNLKIDDLRKMKLAKSSNNEKAISSEPEGQDNYEDDLELLDEEDFS